VTRYIVGAACPVCRAQVAAAEAVAAPNYFRELLREHFADEHETTLEQVQRVSFRACGFSVAYHGPCEAPALPMRRRCERHAVPSKTVCAGCGGVATQECSYAGQFVCGFPLCDWCRHDAWGGHSRSVPGAPPVKWRVRKYDFWEILKPNKHARGCFSVFDAQSWADAMRWVDHLVHEEARP